MAINIFCCAVLFLSLRHTVSGSVISDCSLGSAKEKIKITVQRKHACTAGARVGIWRSRDVSREKSLRGHGRGRTWGRGSEPSALPRNALLEHTAHHFRDNVSRPCETEKGEGEPVGVQVRWCLFMI